MRIVRFDGVGGASGDMILGALESVGISLDVARKAVAELGLRHVHLEVEAAMSLGIAGRRVRVQLEGGHGHPHDHGPHGHGQAHTHGHRRHADIAAMIAAAPLDPPVRDLSLAVFQRLAVAEGRIHGIPPEEVSFHEVGAEDSIADIVGACAMLHALRVDAVACAPLPLGHGEVACAHGVYPLPAPAVVELLRGFPVYAVHETRETVTPTGAALLVEWCARYPAPSVPCAERTLASGFGLGHHAFAGRANVLRVTLGETDRASADAPDRVTVLECEMDDTTGEVVGELCESLMKAGALDVFTTGVQMKKQRPGMLLTVLSRGEDAERLADQIFQRGTTFGIRRHEAARWTMSRRHETVETPYGEVRIKIGAWRGREMTASPEWDDCVARARESGIAPRAVHAAAVAVFQSRS